MFKILLLAGLGASLYFLGKKALEKFEDYLEEKNGEKDDNSTEGDNN